MGEFTSLRPRSAAALNRIGRWLHRSIIDPCRCLPAFAPNSAGDHQTRSQLTLQAANSTFPSLSRLCLQHGARDVPAVLTSQAFAEELAVRTDDSALLELKTLLDHYGSDKANHHDYHFVYASILRERDKIEAVLEIGLGSNNETIVSNMHGGGNPGGSLRALRDYLPRAQVFGADIDATILFQDNRIKTFVVDQLNAQSLDELGRALPHAFDLIIDDGLHAPDANINTLNFGLSRLKPGGWIVIEDIAPAALSIWQVVGTLLAPHLHSWLVEAKGSWLFVVQANGSDPSQ